MILPGLLNLWGGFGSLMFPKTGWLEVPFIFSRGSVNLKLGGQEILDSSEVF